MILEIPCYLALEALEQRYQLIHYQKCLISLYDFENWGEVQGHFQKHHAFLELYIELYIQHSVIQTSSTIIKFLLCTMNHVVFTDYTAMFFMKIHAFPRCEKSFNGIKSRHFYEKKESLQ